MGFPVSLFGMEPERERGFVAALGCSQTRRGSVGVFLRSNPIADRQTHACSRINVTGTDQETEKEVSIDGFG